MLSKRTFIRLVKRGNHDKRFAQVTSGRVDVMQTFGYLKQKNGELFFSRQWFLLFKFLPSVNHLPRELKKSG